MNFGNDNEISETVVLTMLMSSPSSYKLKCQWKTAYDIEISKGQEMVAQPMTSPASLFFSKEGASR